MSYVVYLTIILHLPLTLRPKHVSSALTSHFANVRFVKRENSQLITSYYIILPSSQNTANYKVPRTTSGFYCHNSKTNRNLSSVTETKA